MSIDNDAPAEDRDAISVFISYRRTDSGHAGRLGDALEEEFGEEHVFRDVKGIGGGADFPTEIDRALRQAGVVIAVIGPRWDDRFWWRRFQIRRQNDWVHFELEQAHRNGTPVLPVLVDGASMPRRALPPSLRFLSTRNAIRVRDDSWDEDVAKMVKRIREIAHKPVHVAEIRNDPPRRGSPHWLITGTLLLLAITVAWAVSSMNRDGPEFPPVADDAKPAVIRVEVRNNQMSWFATGFFITDDGYALTMLPQDDSASFTVLTHAGASHAARLVARQESMLALLKVDADSTPYLRLAIREPQPGHGARVTGVTSTGRWWSFPALIDTLISGSVYYTRREGWLGMMGSPIIDLQDHVVIGTHWGGSPQSRGDTSGVIQPPGQGEGEGKTLQTLELEPLLERGRLRTQKDSTGILRLTSR